mmetsp:Transcript_17307/g.43438  ORF Transcript_17307/g.43438 Transcript_17307/m.43438 type:complete len:104 (+) Transcript_17307:98-409(+)
MHAAATVCRTQSHSSHQTTPNIVLVNDTQPTSLQVASCKCCASPDIQLHTRELTELVTMLLQKARIAATTTTTTTATENTHHCYHHQQQQQNGHAALPAAAEP